MLPKKGDIMAKGSGGAGRGRGGNRRRQDRDDDGWTKSVWDVRGPRDKPKETAASKLRRQMMNQSVRPAVKTNTRGLTKTMRALQNQLRDLAKRRGYGEDEPIPGTGGLTRRRLSRNAVSREAQEGELRAAITALLRNQTRPGQRRMRNITPVRPLTRPAPIEVPRF